MQFVLPGAKLPYTTLAEAWEHLAAQLIAEAHTPPERLADMRRYFFTGASTSFALLILAGRGKSQTEAFAGYQKLADELNTHAVEEVLALIEQKFANLAKAPIDLSDRTSND